MDNLIKSHVLGFPRVGAKRELKKAVESFWAGQLSEPELKSVAVKLRARAWKLQKNAGIDWIVSGDFSFYDHMLDMSALFGAISDRFHHQSGAPVDLSLYFLMARGVGIKGSHVTPTAAMEMTKWFDTNYHYIAPELSAEMPLKISSSKPIDEFKEALALGVKTVPVLVGPVTFLLLGKIHDEGDADEIRERLLSRLLPLYTNIIAELAKAGAEWIQLDEPVLSLDLTERQRGWFKEAYKALKQSSKLKILLANYFGPLGDNFSLAASLPVDGLHVDAVRGGDELEQVAKAIPQMMLLSVGVVDGRNIWKNDFSKSLAQLQTVREKISDSRLLISSSCSLLHSPFSLRYESAMDPEIKNWLAFSEEKLDEISILAALVSSGDLSQISGELKTKWEENQNAARSRRDSAKVNNSTVSQRLANVSDSDKHRSALFPERYAKQQEKLKLPLFPTTTIGSFPQTSEVRNARSKFKKEELSAEDYDKFLEARMTEAIRWQEEIGIDVLVHGEFERNDMVEYFGENLNGFIFTQNGWVQSYGSRCVKPPIIFGDVSRTQPMTLEWSKRAQSLTNRPMKGMLTGPITILQWSFVRNDQPRKTTAEQIALALRDEILDLEKAGIGIIQLDEPALREGLPLHRKDWEAYLDWSTGAFRLATSAVRDETQIHTHMCYCEFNDVIEAIASLDADVISLETARSQGELLEAFSNFKYPNAIGPGVWDIHSPRVPSTDEMVAVIVAAMKVIDPNRIWVNPDCGLKTRGWDETKASAKNLVECARVARGLVAEHSKHPFRSLYGGDAFRA